MRLQPAGTDRLRQARTATGRLVQETVFSRPGRIFLPQRHPHRPGFLYGNLLRTRCTEPSYRNATGGFVSARHLSSARGRRQRLGGYARNTTQSLSGQDTPHDYQSARSHAQLLPASRIRRRGLHRGEPQHRPDFADPQRPRIPQRTHAFFGHAGVHEPHYRRSEPKPPYCAEQRKQRQRKHRSRHGGEPPVFQKPRVRERFEAIRRKIHFSAIQLFQFSAASERIGHRPPVRFPAALPQCFQKLQRRQQNRFMVRKMPQMPIRFYHSRPIHGH